MTTARESRSAHSAKCKHFPHRDTWCRPTCRCRGSRPVGRWHESRLSCWHDAGSIRHDRCARQLSVAHRRCQAPSRRFQADTMRQSGCAAQHSKESFPVPLRFLATTPAAVPTRGRIGIKTFPMLDAKLGNGLITLIIKSRGTSGFTPTGVQDKALWTGRIDLSGKTH